MVQYCTNAIPQQLIRETRYFEGIAANYSYNKPYKISYALLTKWWAVHKWKLLATFCSGVTSQFYVWALTLWPRDLDLWPLALEITSPVTHLMKNIPTKLKLPMCLPVLKLQFGRDNQRDRRWRLIRSTIASAPYRAFFSVQSQKTDASYVCVISGQKLA